MAAPADGTTTLPPWLPDDYGNVYWQNGWRKQEDTKKTSDVLCFETGHYGLELNVKDLTKVRFGTFDLGDDDGGDDKGGKGKKEKGGKGGGDRLSYADALDMSNRSRMTHGLKNSELKIEIDVGEGGETKKGKYRVRTCLAGKGRVGDRSKAALWEAGRFVQHYEILGLVLKDGPETLNCDADLSVVVWPRSFALTLQIKPIGKETWTGGEDGGGAPVVRMEFGEWSLEEEFNTKLPPHIRREHTLECFVKGNGVDGGGGSGGEIDGISMKWSGLKKPNVPFAWRKNFACYWARLRSPHRTFAKGYTDIRDYDTFTIDVENNGEDDVYVPFIFYLNNPANVTGVVPVLVYPDGTPTGIPLQLSKNWHNKELGPYVRVFGMLPSPAKSAQTFTLQLVYGFYGSLPSASHANLSLVGWNDSKNNGRWEQLAIGCWGETFCIDAELSATAHNVITDVRSIMIRPGADGRMWQWSNAGWGGDWLDGFDGQGRRLNVRGVKVAYLSQGPCLTDVKYGGYYGAFGSQDRVSYLNTVSTLRTDDYARTFHRLRYSFDKSVSFVNQRRGGVACLFRMGGSNFDQMITPRIAIGNADGLIEDWAVPNTLNPMYFFKEELELEGRGPWWIAFPEMRCLKDRTMGQGWRALVVQSYNVTVQDTAYENPVVTFYVRKKEKNVTKDGDVPNIDVLLRPPKGVTTLGPGNTASIDLYWITLPHNAVDYYGPNEALRRHLEEKPDSWETVLREVQGNDLKVEVTGGTVERTYPLLIRSSGKASEIEVTIAGGVGAVPVTFENLDGGTYKLYKSTSSEDEQCELTSADDSYQVNYDAETFTYAVTYNLPLDEVDTSSWILKK